MSTTVLENDLNFATSLTEIMENGKVLIKDCCKTLLWHESKTMVEKAKQTQLWCKNGKLWISWFIQLGYAEEGENI